MLVQYCKWLNRVSGCGVIIVILATIGTVLGILNSVIQREFVTGGNREKFNNNVD